MSCAVRVQFTVRKGGRRVTRKSATWYAEFKDGHGARHRIPTGLRDKGACEELARLVQRYAELRGSGHEPDRELAKWIADLDPAIMARLVALGIVPPSRASGGKPLTDWLDEYARVLELRGRAPKYVKNVRYQVERVREALGWRVFGDLDAAALERWLGEERERELARTKDSEERGLAPKASNNYLVALKSFAKWIAEELDVPHPLARLETLELGSRDRRRIRRALSDEELAALMAAAEPRGRKLWYMLAVLAGLRRGDLVRLTWGDVDIEAGVLTIRDGKAKRDDLVPIHPELLEELKRAGPGVPAARLFARPVKNATRRKDFVRAGIPTEPDEQGLVCDLHALRTTLGTRIARAGIAPQVAKGLMRHSDYRTTLKHYTRLSLCDAASAMESLPGIPAPKPETSEQKATGTDGPNLLQRPLQQAQQVRGDSVRLAETPDRTGGTQKADSRSSESSAWLGRQASNLRPGG